MSSKSKLRSVADEMGFVVVKPLRLARLQKTPLGLHFRCGGTSTRLGVVIKWLLARMRPMVLCLPTASLAHKSGEHEHIHTATRVEYRPEHKQASR